MNSKDHLHSEKKSDNILDSWKEISSYLERSEKTCRKWEKELGLPVHRLEESPKARVFSYKEELDSWRMEKLGNMKENGGERENSFSKRIFGKQLLVILMFGIIISLLLINPNIFKKNRSVPVAPDKIKTLAVLPLVNINGEEIMNCFADGMTDALITELAKIKHLKVISRTSIMYYKDQKKPLKEIAGELEADCIVEGTIFCDKDDLRITVQLIDSKEDVHLWAGNYRKKFRDIIDLQKNIALDIVHNVSVSISSEEIDAIQGSDEINLKAYENYLRGTIEFDKTTRKSLYTAIDFFNKAINIDPGFARGYAWIGISHFILAQMDTIPPRENFLKAKEYADKALEVDKNCAEAIAVLGVVEWGYDWDYTESEALFKKAVSISPSSAIVHNLHRNFLYSMGRMEETSDVMKLICELDPNSQWNKVLKLWASGDKLSVKIERLKKLREIQPDDWRVTGVLAGLYISSGQFEHAIAMAKRGVEINNNHYEPLVWLANTYGAIGKKEEARRILDGLIERDRTDYVSPSQIAEVLCSLGMVDKAFTYFDRAYREKDWRLLHNILLWPSYEPVRNVPRYDALIEKMGLSK